ncbi:intradiol ring-cleavage dioxygenase [Streptosporangium carneum]|uniref:Protocatechuate dioxygenase n=1 Tax=Streptosporangium carneum TaxID=47481 RepID=A0A9W6MGQ9_9ACTN|nr:intradiol ring-cleavage dioxygenase [Streptosporangium carneum]GLK13168.1 protocatechuate dioxygenase [Streptosporangium carneum]
MKEIDTPGPSRRQILIAGGVGIAAAGLGAAYLATTASASPGTCMKLTQETIEGPYYLDYDKHRSDITEQKPGVPVLLRVRVVDAENCRPLRDVAVDIWHCDALGVYSSYEKQSSGDGGVSPTALPAAAPDGSGGGMHAAPDSGTTFFRGFQMTDQDGWVTFRTVFPGWYVGRAIHIHTKVHVNGVLKDGAYVGGNDCHTGQLYFPEKAIEAVARTQPYSTNTRPRTTNAQDMLHTGDTPADGMLDLRYDPKRLTEGVQASITLGVDPDAVHNGQDWP